MDTIETRNTLGELRALPGSRTVAGYAIVFNALSEDLGGFREQIAPEAARGLAGHEVRAYYNHNTDHMLGRTGNGTVRTQVDGRGVGVEIDVPRTGYGDAMLELIGRGDITGMSFGFRTLADGWDDRARPPVRTILEMRVFEVSVVSHPAYPDTTVALRSLQILAGRSLKTLLLEHRQRTAGWR